MILFEEWGTSGRSINRPTMGHLLRLLVRIELFRAADYVAVSILGEHPPERPKHGPAAIVDTRIPDEVLQREMESQLEPARYPNTASLNANAPTEAYHVNQNYPNELNIDQCKVDFSSAQRMTLTQSNNSTNTNNQQLDQMAAHFAQLSTSTNRTESTNTQAHAQHIANAQQIQCSSKIMNRVDDGGLNLSNGVSNGTQDTSQSINMSSESEYIPRMIEANGLVSDGTISIDHVPAQIPAVITGNGTSSVWPESNDVSTNSAYTNSFIPLAVLNGNSSQSNCTTQNSINSESMLHSDVIGANGLPSSNKTSSMSTKTNSRSTLIPLSVVSENGNHSSAHNDTSSKIQLKFIRQDD